VLRELPFDVPPVHVEAVWHRRTAHSSAHQWLRQTLADAARAGFYS
jgi:DNA-binding transcriptional LysR family regulator